VSLNPLFDGARKEAQAIAHRAMAWVSGRLGANQVYYPKRTADL
jgi:hypothetical protein